MVSNKKIKQIINEDPDQIVRDHKRGDLTTRYNVQFGDMDSVTFGFYNGKLYAGFGGSHLDLLGDVLKNEPEFKNRELTFKEKYQSLYDILNFSGRLWRKSKLMSFWDYPPRNKFFTIIKQLENFLGEKILNNDWLIEVMERDSVSTSLIPVEEYTGEYYDPPEEKRKDHILSPLLKKQQKKKPYDAYDKLKMEPAKWKHYKDKNIAEKIIREEIINYLDSH